MPNRKASRTFAVPVWSTKEKRMIQPGQPVPLDHLSDDAYTRLNDAYPETMTAAEAKAKAEADALSSPNRKAAEENG